MRHQDCYRILRVSEYSGIDEVKSSYRRLAFELHPDLNPDKPNASQKFQELNEAYVFLIKHLEENGPTPRPKTREKKKTPGPSAKTKPDGPPPGPNKSARRGFYKKEEVLHDILKDPFAKQVFEDIYRHLKNKGDIPRHKRKKKELRFDLGRFKLHLDLSRGIWGTVKHWFRKQMNDERTLYLPSEQLTPGSSVRFQVKQAWTKNPSSVEITLPGDYVIGRPIRLKGLGRKLGPWRGDLYLRLLAK